MGDSFYIPAGEDTWLATPHTTGPWDARAQHGGPPSALLGRAIQRCAPRDDMIIARFTCEILRPIPVGEIQVERNGSLGSVTGFPSIVVPGGFTKPTATAKIGVPVGIEFLGRPWSEGVLIEIAYGYEQGTKNRKVPPTTPKLKGEP